MDTGPDPRHLRRLAMLLAMPDADGREALREIADQEPWIIDAIAELESLPVEHWQAEHTRLFIAGYPRTPCPPFESVYRQGQMGGSMAGDLREFYRRVGLEPAAAPADYLGTLLDCAAYLADLTQDAIPANDPASPASALRAELWDDHLLHWLSRFAHDLEQHAQLKLYRLLGAQLARLVPAPVNGT